MSHQIDGLPIYRYLLMMPRNGFTEQEFIDKVMNSPDEFTVESCTSFLKALINTRILEKRGEEYFFTIQN